MKEYKYKINGNTYKVTIGDIDENIAHVEVNGTPYKVEMEKAPKVVVKPVTRPTTPAPAPITMASAVSISFFSLAIFSLISLLLIFLPLFIWFDF